MFHAPLIAATPGLELETIVTRDVGPVWERADELDFVVVASPNDSHVELASAAIDAGLAVVVDKPLAVTAADARALIDRADAARVPLTVFHNRRWDSDFLEVRRLIDSGELGEVWRFESRFERWRPEAPEGAWRFSVPRERGGGVLLDLGTHLVDQALQLFGPAATVHGEVHARRGGPADDDAFIAIEHTSGVLSHLWASEVAASPGPRMRVQGSKRGFVFEELDGQEAELRDGKQPSGEWPEFYRRFEAALRGEGELPVDPRDAVAVLEVLERVAAASP